MEIPDTLGNSFTSAQLLCAKIVEGTASQAEHDKVMRLSAATRAATCCVDLGFPGCCVLAR